MTKKQATKKNLLFIILLMAIVGGAVYYFSSSSGGVSLSPDEIMDGLTEDKYQLSIKKINDLISLYQSGLFKDKKYVNLKSFITLPLEIGLIGKANPFELPLAPEELLKQGQAAQ